VNYNDVVSSIADETERRIYRDMFKYIRFLVSINRVQGHWTLNEEDLTSECFLALARCYRKYGCRLSSTITYNQFLAVVKTSIKNAIATLKYKAFLVTGRKKEFEGVSLDDEEAGIEIEGGPNPEAVYDSTERVNELVCQLSTFEVRVLNAALGGDERVRMYLQTSADRRSWVFRDPTISITPLVVARALCEPVSWVEGAYKRIGELLKDQVSVKEQVSVK